MFWELSPARPNASTRTARQVASVVAGVAAAIAASSNAIAQKFNAVQVIAVEDTPVGLKTRLYATGFDVKFGDPLLSVCADIHANGGVWYQHAPLDGGGDLPPDPADIVNSPNLAHDTFVTFNRCTSDDDTTNIPPCPCHVFSMGNSLFHGEWTWETLGGNGQGNAVNVNLTDFYGVTHDFFGTLIAQFTLRGADPRGYSGDVTLTDPAGVVDVDLSWKSSCEPNRRQVILLDRSGSMNKPNADGLTRCQRALGRAVADVFVFHNALAPPGETAVFTFNGAGQADVNMITIGFVDKWSAAIAIASLDPTGCGGKTPLADAICIGVEALLSCAGGTEYQLAISSDGLENNSDGPCDGRNDADGIEPWDPLSWQAHASEAIVGTAGIVTNVRQWGVLPRVPTGGSCPWDLNGDARVATADLLDLLAAWGTDPGGPPDFDESGDVGSTDLLALLSNWGECDNPSAEETAAFYMSLTEATGGVYTFIDDNDPLPLSIGACCLPAGACEEDVEVTQCVNVKGGEWAGEGSTCDDCP